MKFLVVCAFLVVGAFAELDPDEAFCVEQLHLDKDVMEKLLQQEHYPLDNADLINYLACFGKRIGIQKEDGSIEWDKIDEYLGKALENIVEGDTSEDGAAAMFFITVALKDAVDKCKTKKFDGSNGEIVAKLHNCVFEGFGDLAKDKKWPEWEQVRAHCLEETKVDKSVAERVNDGTILPLDDEDINKYMKCEGEQAGVLKGDGTVNWEALDELMGHEVSKIFERSEPQGFMVGFGFAYALDHCEKQHFEGDNPGQVVVKVQNCVIKHMSEAYASK